jgi:hypothetical protein
MSKLPKIANPSRRAYPSDLSDSEWSTIAPLLPGNKGFGHPRTVDLREIINAIFVTVPSVAVVGAKKKAHFPSVLPNRRE